MLAALCVAAPSCTSDRTAPGTREEQLIVLLPSAPRDLDPRFVLDSSSMKVSRLIFRGLVTVDNASLEPEMDLAESVRIDGSDPLVWHVRLRAGARFHDGQAVDGHDVVYTFRSVLDPAVGSPYRSEYASRIAEISLDPDDPLHVVFRLKAPLATFRTDLVLGIVPEHLLASRTDGRFAPETFIGTGAFAYVERLSETRVVLERWPNDAEDSWKYLVFSAVSDESTRLLSLLAGSADIAQNSVSPVLLDVLADRPEVRVETAESISLTYLGLNLRVPHLADVRVRRALSHAIDRQSIIEHRFQGRATEAFGLLAPFHWAFAADIPRYGYAPETARRLLDEAGYPADPETGIRFRLEFKLSSDRFRVGVARMLARHLEAVGVAVDLRPFEFGSFFADIRAGRFEVFLLQLPEPVEPDMYRWMFEGRATPPVPADPAGPPAARHDRRAFPPEVSRALRDPDCRAWSETAVATGLGDIVRGLSGLSPPRGAGNRTFYADVRTDCLLERGRRTLGREGRIAIYREVQHRIAESVPIVPLWHEEHIAVLRRDLDDFRILPNGRLTPLNEVRRLRTER